MIAEVGHYALVLALALVAALSLSDAACGSARRSRPG